MFQLFAAIKNNNWGCRSLDDSVVAKFSKPNNKGPWSEACFGPGGRVYDRDTGAAQICGEFLLEKQHKLPIMGKLIDIQKPPPILPLSVSMPRGAVALKKTLLLLGWKPVEEIKEFLATLVRAGLPSDLGSLLTWSRMVIDEEKFVNELVNRVHALNKSSILALREKLAKCMAGTPAERFSGFLHNWEQLFETSEAAADPGLLFAGLLNVVELQAGDGVVLPAGVPHAYLGGQIAEVMYSGDAPETDSRLQYQTPPPTAFRCRAVGGSSGVFYEFGEGLGISTFIRATSPSIRTFGGAQVMVFLDGAEGALRHGDGKAVSLTPFTAYLLQPSSRYELKLRNGSALRFFQLG